jgi:hypothetical protein
MLNPGMNVVFTFHRCEYGERVIVVLDELPSGTRPTLFRGTSRHLRGR